MDTRSLIALAASKPTEIGAVCIRLVPHVFAEALKRSQRLDDAHASIEPVLCSICQAIIDGALPPDEWQLSLAAHVRKWCDENSAERMASDAQVDSAAAGDAVSDETYGGLSAMDTLPRIRIRRQVTQLMCQLETPDLTSVLMSIENKASVAEMAAVVGMPETDAVGRLAEAYRQLYQGLDIDNAEHQDPSHEL